MFDLVTPSLRFKGKRKTVFITGASSGIGLATAERFAENGFNVYATARDPNNAIALQKLATKYPSAIRVVKLDITDSEKDINTLFKFLDPIDILINNAGMGLIGPVHTTTDAQRRKVFDTNLFGLLNVTCAVLDQMIARKSGTIISISSIVGPLPDPKQAAYSASKAALEHFMAVLREDLKQIPDCNIRIANIHPGPVLTNFKNAAPNGERFQQSDNPYSQTEAKRLEWETIMTKQGRPISETVDKIFDVACYQANPNLWNPTEDAVQKAFERVFKDPTGNSFMVGLAAENVTQKLKAKL